MRDSDDRISWGHKFSTRMNRFKQFGFKAFKISKLIRAPVFQIRALTSEAAFQIK